MNDQFLLFIMALACLLCIGVGYTLGQSNGFQKGFADCSAIWNGEESEDEGDDVLNAREIK